ncbi:MAG TPA: hypothetical protein VLI39_07550 [Sedimentisphaerales bacterium]|nr:hypothetical protein [Sedimentisphaerales bacterium]
MAKNWTIYCCGPGCPAYDKVFDKCRTTDRKVTESPTDVFPDWCPLEDEKLDASTEADDTAIDARNAAAWDAAVAWAATAAAAAAVAAAVAPEPETLPPCVDDRLVPTPTWPISPEDEESDTDARRPTFSSRSPEDLLYAEDKTFVSQGSAPWPVAFSQEGELEQCAGCGRLPVPHRAAYRCAPFYVCATRDCEHRGVWYTRYEWQTVMHVQRQSLDERAAGGV